jgi:hypothetical protein
MKLINLIESNIIDKNIILHRYDTCPTNQNTGEEVYMYTNYVAVKHISHGSAIKYKGTVIGKIETFKYNERKNELIISVTIDNKKEVITFYLSSEIELID